MGECGVDLVEGDVGERDRPGVVEVGLNGRGVEREGSLVDEGEEEGYGWGSWQILDWGRVGGKGDGTEAGATGEEVGGGSE